MGEIATHSHTALDRSLTCAAELWVAIASEPGRLLGQFQRESSSGSASSASTFVRGSGGPAVIVGPGTVHVALSLEHPGVLVPCPPSRIVNRSVRPLLRAISRTGFLAHYFGRDWVSVAHRPIAWVGFGHDAGSQRTLFEAFVAVNVPFSSGARASFRGREPATLSALGRCDVDPERLAEAIFESYAGFYGAELLPMTRDDGADRRPGAGASGTFGDGPAEGSTGRPEPPWLATVEEAIGTLGAGPDCQGVFRVGGDWLVSRDALRRLEERAALATESELGAVVDEALATPGVALDGIQDLGSVRDVLAAAKRTLASASLDATAGLPQPR